MHLKSKSELLAKNLFLSALAALAFNSCHRVVQIEMPPEQTYVHKYGLEVEPDYWCESGQNGCIITKMRDGVTVTQTFANGMLNGDASYTFPHQTQVQRREFYENDNLIKQTIYLPSGVPLESTEYDSPTIWTTTVWYENGHPKAIEKFDRNLLVTGKYYNMQNQKDSWVYNGMGERMSRDSEGHLISLDTFRGGELVEKTFFHPNMCPKEIISFACGKVHGERKTYYPGGDPMAFEVWTEGKKNGTTIIFQNGEKYAEVPFLDGKKNGVERRFRDGSVVTQEITWYEDKMHGPTYTYVGDAIQSDWFYNGRLTSRSNFESYAPKCN